MRVTRTLAAVAAVLVTVGALVAGSIAAGADPLSPEPYSDCATVAGNLIQNCGFETGDFTDWTVTPASFFSAVGVVPNPHSGSYSADFHAPFADDQISQTLTGTAPGQPYTLGYWLDINVVDLTHFVVTMSNVGGGTETFDEQTNMLRGDTGWVYEQDTFVTGSGAPTVTFGAHSDQIGPGFTLVDDVVVVNAASGSRAQAITFTSSPPPHPVAGDTYTATATGGGSGNPVQFYVDASSVGVCTVAENGNVSFTTAGKCRIGAIQAGNGFYAPAAITTQIVTVSKTPQSVNITFFPGHAVVGGLYTVAATGGASTNPIVFTAAANSSSVCTITTDGSTTLTALAPGKCIITARQAGNSQYQAGSAKKTIKIYAS